MSDILRFACGHCGKQLSVKPQHAGRSTRCPGCQHPVTVPHPDPEPNPSESLSEDEAFRSLEEVDSPIPTPPQHKAADQRVVLFQELANDVENNEIAAALSIIDQLKRDATGQEFADLWKLERELKKSQQTELRTTSHSSHPTTVISDTRESSPPKKVMDRQTIPALNLDELAESTISDVTTPPQRTASQRTTREPISALPQVTHSGRNPWIVTAVAVGSIIVVAGIFAAFQLGKATATRSDSVTTTKIADTSQTTPASENVQPSIPAAQNNTSVSMRSTDAPSAAIEGSKISNQNAGEIVNAYLAASTWDQRLPLMVNFDDPPTGDSPLPPPGKYSPAAIISSTSTKSAKMEISSVEVDISTSHPQHKSVWFNLIRTPNGHKIDAAAMLDNAAKSNERLEAARRAEEERLLLEKAEREPPVDATEQFKQITTFPERYIGRRLYIDGTINLQLTRRNKQFNCFALNFERKIGEVSGGPYRDQLSFITTEEMGANLVEIRARDGRAIVHVKLRYLEPAKKEYPVGDVTKIEILDFDPVALQRFKRYTLHPDGKVETHPNPSKQ